MPRLLVIDDQFGRHIDARRDLCTLFDLQDVTGDDHTPEKIKDPLAETVFCSGQTLAEGVVTNTVGVAIDATRAGWPFSTGERWAILLLDLRFVSGKLDAEGNPAGQPGDDEFGLRILEVLKREFPLLPVVVLSSRDRAEVIEDCRKLGAADFIQRHAVNGPRPRELLAEKLREYGLLEDQSKRIVGCSLNLLRALSAARRAATGTGNILVLGETGTGKELLARFIHDHSPKSSGPYSVFHAFGTAETLQEDQLFGHVKGAFTDARSDRPGLFEQASGGTLFIDEIGDIPETLQNKLLRPIETRCVMRQGADQEVGIDVQLVLATNKALDDYTATGRFKFDLLNRIRAYPITLPPLRERRDDIPLLAGYMLESLCRENGARWPRKIHPEAMNKLMSHDWGDGNVRELRNVLERAVKDNKDSEIVVAGDIRFDAALRPLSVVKSERAARVLDASAKQPNNENWLTGVREARPLADYAFLHGSWQPLQREVALLLARYLACAIDATRKRRADGPPQGEVNITGAVSCLLGQQVSTIKAADFIKRLLQFDEEESTAIVSEYPVLREVLAQAFRVRPRQPRKVYKKLGGAS
ncbi:MAG: sigma 54-interacting transcriptional regulator [Nitrososphaera sp.]|nr:sigma 54-interacting transcriptional regulator [Nitrososphaera sp.]